MGPSSPWPSCFPRRRPLPAPGLRTPWSPGAFTACSESWCLHDAAKAYVAKLRAFSRELDALARTQPGKPSELDLRLLRGGAVDVLATLFVLRDGERSGQDHRSWIQRWESESFKAH